MHVVVRLPRAVDIVAEAARYEEHGISEQLADAAGQISGVKDEPGHGKARVMGKRWKPKLAWEPLGVQVRPALQSALDTRAGPSPRKAARMKPNLSESQIDRKEAGAYEGCDSCANR